MAIQQEPRNNETARPYDRRSSIWDMVLQPVYAHSSSSRVSYPQKCHRKMFCSVLKYEANCHSPKTQHTTENTQTHDNTNADKHTTHTSLQRKIVIKRRTSAACTSAEALKLYPVGFRPRQKESFNSFASMTVTAQTHTHPDNKPNRPHRNTRQQGPRRYATTEHTTEIHDFTHPQTPA